MRIKFKQKAVYWASPVSDGYGGYTYDAGVEVDVRWEDKQEMFIDKEGREALSHAIVYLEQDVDIGEYFWLGDIDDLDSQGEDDPAFVSGAREIRAFNKIPNVSSTTYLRKAWL